MSGLLARCLLLASLLPGAVLRERILIGLTNPDFAVLLLCAGVLLIYLEFNRPGSVVPGSLGVLLVLLAVFGLGRLALHPASVFVLLVGLALLLVEFRIPSHGLLAVAGTVALIFGLATLVDSPTACVHLGVAVSAGTSFGIISYLLATIAIRARRNKFLLGPEAILGHIAIARTALAPSGQIEVRGELWQALLRGRNHVGAGSQVMIRERDGLTLIVEATS